MDMIIKTENNNCDNAFTLILMTNMVKILKRNAEIYETQTWFFSGPFYLNIKSMANVCPLQSFFCVWIYFYLIIKLWYWPQHWPHHSRQHWPHHSPQHWPHHWPQHWLHHWPHCWPQHWPHHWPQHWLHHLTHHWPHHWPHCWPQLWP